MKLSKITIWRLNASINELVLIFQEYGYQNISKSDILDYLVNYRWKKIKPETINLMKKDIQLITVNDFFDFQQVKTMKQENFDDMEYLL